MIRFHHVNLGIPVGAQDAEAAFLVDILGYRRAVAPPELDRLVNWFESDDGTQVHLSEDPDHRPAARAHVAVDVGHDLPALEARLQRKGVHCTALGDAGGRIVFCQDPAGNRWEIRGTPVP
jgi:catechol 2,3-dioxygenase-like lactoylglutathione lyase family enzyme